MATSHTVRFTKEILVELYVNQTKSIREIAKEFKCHDTTILYHLRKFNIPSRSKADATKLGASKLVKYEMEKDQVAPLARKGLSIQEISEVLAIPYSAVYKYVKQNMIKTVTTSKRYKEQRSNAKIQISKQVLERLYNQEQLTLKQIGQKYKLSPGSILNRMKEYGIARRTISEASKLVYTKEPHKRELARQRANSRPKLAYNSRTDIEKMFIKWANDHSIKIKEQVSLYKNGHKYDFLIEGTNLLIEVDGDYWHNTPKQQKKDKLFEGQAHERGYTVKRFARSDIIDSKSSVFDELLIFL